MQATSSNPEPNPNWHERAALIIGLAVPNRYRYLITSELIEQGAQILRSGKPFDVHLNREQLGAGFVSGAEEGIGEFPGVMPEGISAAGLITLVPRIK